MRPGRRPSFNWKERVLEFLLKSGGARAGTIERTLGISHAQLHRVLKKLLSEGLIMRRGHMYVPLISEPPKEYRAEVALIHALEIFRARMKMLTSFHIEGRVPYLRLSLDLYKRLHPEKKIAYGPPMVEIPLDDLISDDSKLEILENCGLLKIKNKQTENGLIQELHFRQSRHPMEPGLFYRASEPTRITPTKEEIQQVITDFAIEAAETIRGEAEKILREHGLTYDSLPDGPL
ncbi:MAG: helix-turn-helix domain-containing protein [Nitrososphaerota archaeon]